MSLSETIQAKSATVASSRAQENQTPPRVYGSTDRSSSGDASDNAIAAEQTRSRSQPATGKATGKSGAHAADEGEHEAIQQDPETLDDAPPVPPVPTDENEQAPKPAAVKTPREQAEGLTLLHFNAGTRLAKDIAGLAIYVEKLRAWHVWGGTHWRHDGAEALTVRELAKDTVAGIAVEGIKAESGEKKKLAQELSRGRGISDLLMHAKGERGIRVDVDELDRHPELMAARNGTVDLRTRKLRASRPADLLTRCAGADYDEHASAPTFHKFLREIQPEPEARAYLQRLIGCAAVGAVREHVLPIWWGPGANGKSVLADVVGHALGDHATTGPASLIDRSGKRDAHPADKMTCFGRRLVVIHETKKRAQIDAAKVKQLTGGDRVEARAMGKDWINFAPTHSLLLLSNFKPSADARDGGLWRRLQVVPFDVVIPEEQQDRTLAERIKADEAAGVLRWIVEGAAAYLAKGLHPPKVVVEQTAAYRTASDTFEEFLSECAVTGPAYTVRGGELIQRHRAWCELRGFEAMRGNEIADELQARGFERKLKGGRVTYAGLRLRTDDVEVSP